MRKVIIKETLVRWRLIFFSRYIHWLIVAGAAGWIITQSCTSGTSKTEMPAEKRGFHNMETAQQNEKWKAPPEADNMENPLAGDASATRKGEALFEKYCARCHGEQGEGDGPDARLYETKPADLAAKRIVEQSDGALFWKITHGKPPMPSFEAVLDKNQRWQLVSYIRKLQEQD